MQFQDQRGVAYLFVLLAMFLLALVAGRVADVHSTSAQREREEELIAQGRIYRTAIGEYYQSAPSGQKSYPPRLEDLLRDSRHAVTRRYIRRLARDPMTGQAFVPLASPEGGIWGIASGSSATPLRAVLPPDVVVTTPRNASYKDWMFVYVPPP